MAIRHEIVFRRGYALAVFNPNDCAEDTTLRNLDGSWAFRNTRFYPAYPGVSGTAAAMAPAAPPMIMKIGATIGCFYQPRQQAVCVL